MARHEEVEEKGTPGVERKDDEEISEIIVSLLPVLLVLVAT